MPKHNRQRTGPPGHHQQPFFAQGCGQGISCVAVDNHRVRVDIADWEKRLCHRFVPILATIGVFILLYVYGALQYNGMRQPQAFFNLLINNVFLLITSVGMTFVILSEGIDLSVRAMIALTSVASAALLEDFGMSPFVVLPLMLLKGAAFGGTMGAITHFFKVQPFIVTLAGMFFARGMFFFISLDAIPIRDPFDRTLALARIPIPFFE